MYGGVDPQYQLLEVLDNSYARERLAPRRLSTSASFYEPDGLWRHSEGSLVMLDRKERPVLSAYLFYGKQA